MLILLIYFFKISIIPFLGGNKGYKRSFFYKKTDKFQLREQKLIRSITTWLI